MKMPINLGGFGQFGGLMYVGILLLVLALVAYVLGAKGIAGFSLSIAKFVIVVFVILAIVFFLF